MAKKNWLYAARIVWPELVKAAANRELLHYEDIAPAIPTNSLSVGKALGPIQTFCMEQNLPPLTSIVVNKVSGIPGTGFVAWNLIDLNTAHELVFDFDWSSLANPFAKVGIEDNEEGLAQKLLVKPDLAHLVYAKVPVRGVAQVIFRKALVSAYGAQCAMCRVSFERALEAAHIVPWEAATAQEKMDPRNGLLLCATHHKLFDAALITVTPSLRVAYRDPKMTKREHTPSDKATTAALHGKLIVLPTSKKHRPSRILLKRRHSTQQWTGLI